MVELAKNPQYWRKCAEWACRIANAIHDEQARRLMLSVAKDYERAAELTEKQLRALSNRNCRSQAKTTASLPPNSRWMNRAGPSD
ncbi:MAG: hypothetical protein WAV78_52875, partial [Xanthobacteraceae bacterium]